MTGAPGPGQGPAVAGSPGAAPGALTAPLRRWSGSARLIGAAGLVAFALLAGACGGADSEADAGGEDGGVPDPLVVGLVPNIAPDEQRARYADFQHYLEQTLGVTVELFVASDYAGVVAAMASDRLDLAYFGGVTYVQAEQQLDVVPLVTEIDRETSSPEYVSAVIVPAESPFTDVGDVVDAGARFAMGDVASTSGSLYPRIMLVDAGAECDTRRLNACPPLERVDFIGGHDAAVQAVLSGNADAAGVERRILHRLIEEGTVPEGAVRVVGEREVMGYPWVARTALGAEAHEAITQAFLDIDDPELLSLLRAESYTAVTAADYDEIRERTADLGLLTPGAP